MQISDSRGAITYWSLGGQTDPSPLCEGIEQLGLGSFAPTPRTWLMSLKAAMAEHFAKAEDMIRPLKKKEANGYTVVHETKGTEENSYSKRVNAKVDKDDGTVSVFSDELSIEEIIEVRTTLQRLTHHYRRVLPSSSVTEMLVDIIGPEKLGGVATRKQGGVYFLKEESLPTWKSVCAVVENSAVRPTENDITVVELTLNAQTLRDVKRGISREVEREAERLRDEITNNDLGETALLNRATRAAELRERITEYETILGETLGVCRQNLQVAVSAFAVATAESDQKQTFEGVF